ncbi:MAG TPA: hypothetical protein VGF59_23725, partial [Bryobacteraceae bacterium]
MAKRNGKHGWPKKSSSRAIGNGRHWMSFTTRFFLFLSAAGILAASDKSGWRIQFQGEAPCYNASGKQVFTLSASQIPDFNVPGVYSGGDYLRDIADSGGKLPLTDSAGHTTFDISGCGAAPVHSTE